MWRCILRRRIQNCNWYNVHFRAILRYFFKSRSWRHFYHPRSKIVISHTPRWKPIINYCVWFINCIKGTIDNLSLWHASPLQLFQLADILFNEINIKQSIYVGIKSNRFLTSRHVNNKSVHLFNFSTKSSSQRSEEVTTITTIIANMYLAQ